MPRPTFEPTPEQRVQVRTLAECGAPEDYIATKIGVAKNTLSKHFAAELEAGQQEAKLQVSTFTCHGEPPGSLSQRKIARR